MASDPPELESPSVRNRLSEAFDGQDRWGENNPEGLQAILDVLDRQTVAAVDNAGDLSNVSTEGVPYVETSRLDNDTPGQDPDAFDELELPLGADMKQLGEALSALSEDLNERATDLSSLESRVLPSVESVTEIGELDDVGEGQIVFVAGLDTTVEVVEYSGSDSFTVEILGRATVAGESDLPDAEYFATGEEIEERGGNTIWEVTP